MTNCPPTGEKPQQPRSPIGYGRVSTDDQNLTLQLDARKKSCEGVFSDKASGARLARPGIDDARSHLRAGDTLVVWKLDRLGRSVKGLVDLVNMLEARDVHFRSLTNGMTPKRLLAAFHAKGQVDLQ